MQPRADQRRVTALRLRALAGYRAFWRNRRLPRWPLSLRHNVRRRPFLVAFSGLAVLLVVTAVACGSVFVHFQRGGAVALSVMTPVLERALAENLGEGRRVAIGQATITRSPDGAVAVTATDVVIRDADGRSVAAVPQLAIGLESLPMGGRPSVRRIDLIGAEVALKVGQDGRIAVATGRQRETPPAVPADQPAVAELTSTLPEPELSPFRRLGIWLDLIEQTGLDGNRLNGIGLRNGRVVVDDERSGRRFVFAGIDLDLAAPETGGLTLSIASSGSLARWTASGIIARRAEDGRRRLNLAVTGLSPRDLALATGHPETFHLTTPISGDITLDLDADGDPAAVRGHVQLGQGEAGDPQDSALRLVVDEARADIAWNAGEQEISIPRIAFAAGAMRAEASGRITPPASRDAPGAIDLVRLSTNTALINPGETPVPVVFRDGRFVYDPATRTLGIERLTLDQNGAVLGTVAGRIVMEGRTPAIDLDMRAGRLPMALALALWPRKTNPHARQWAVENMSGGTTDDTLIRLRIPSDALVNDPPRLEADQLLVQSKLRGTEVRIRPGLSPLRNADIDLRVDGQSARLSLLRAEVPTGPGRRLALREGSFEIADHRMPGPRSVSRFRLEGPAEAALEMLGQEALQGPSNGPPLPSGNVRGTINARVTVTVPIIENPPRNQIDYRIEADIAGFAADKGFGDMRLEAATFRVNASQRDFALTGNGRMGGAQAQFEYRKASPTARAEIRLNATLDDAGRARLGLGTAGRLSGPTPLRVTSQGDDSGRYVVDADLTQAALSDLIPGWTKPRGQPGRARFTAVETDDGWRLEDINVEGRGVLVRGSAVLDENGTLISGNFPAYHLSDGDRASVQLQRVGAVHRVTVRADMLDARHLLRSIADPPRPTGPSGPPAEMELDLKAAAIVGGNGEVVRQLELRIARRGQEIRSLNASARIGRNALLAADLRGQGAAQRMVLRSGDAGATLRFFDLYKTLDGGDLALVMTPIQQDGSIREGSVEIANFAIRNDQAVAGMVAAASEATPERNVAQPGQRQRGETLRANDGTMFQRLKADFRRTQTVVEVREGLVWGPAIGATVEGEFDLNRNRMRLRGTYVPAYALNNAFARIPVLGFFLGGAPDEGLIGITYEISGDIDRPRLLVNPLSAVAPGFLRKIFEFRGSRSQTTPAANDAALNR